MKNFNDKKRSALELLLKNYEIARGAYSPSENFKKKEQDITIYIEELHKSNFEEAEHLSDFTQTCTALLATAAGVLAVDQTDFDMLAVENMQYGKTHSPSHIVTVDKHFLDKARDYLHQLDIDEKTTPGRIHVNYTFDTYTFSRHQNGEKMSYKINAGRGQINKRRVIVDTLLKDRKVLVEKIAEKTEHPTDNLKKEVRKINDTISDRLNISGRNLFMFSDNGKEILLNDKDFYIDRS